MEDSEHRALWGALGVALLIAGLVVLSDWSFVVAASTSKRDLAVLWWPWAGALVLMAFGVYVLVAASNERLWLPGRAELARKRSARRQAELALGWFHNRGSLYSTRESTSVEEYTAWFESLGRFVADAWGLSESSVLLPPGPTTTVENQFLGVTERIGRLIERCRILAIRQEFDPWAVPKPDWLVYVEAMKIPPLETPE